MADSSSIPEKPEEGGVSLDITNVLERNKSSLVINLVDSDKSLEPIERSSDKD